MSKVSLTLAVFFVFLLIMPTLAQQWQTFYLDPKDPHWVKKEDPAGRLRDAGDRWISNCLRGHPRPKIYFKIPEFGNKGGYIKFYYGKSNGWNQLHLYASKDGKKYVELWKSPEWGTLDKTEVTVKIPPGYKYFYFYLRDGNGYHEKLILWKKIQFKTFGAPTPTPTPTPAIPKWQTFYLDPKDPHWVKKEDPKGRLKDEGDRWVSNCYTGDPRPKIYFKILEFGDKGGYIKFYYGKSGGWNQLHLYASKDGREYVELWKSPEWGTISKREVTVKIPSGYKYFYFYLRDGNGNGEKLILWKKIQFKTFGAPAPTPTPAIPKAKIKVVDIKGYITTTALGSSMVALIYLLTRMR